MLRTQLIIVKSCLKFCDIKLLLSAFVLILQLTCVCCYSNIHFCIWITYTQHKLTYLLVLMQLHIKIPHSKVIRYIRYTVCYWHNTNIYVLIRLTWCCRIMLRRSLLLFLIRTWIILLFFNNNKCILCIFSGNAIFIDHGNPYTDKPLKVGEPTLDKTIQNSPMHTKGNQEIN